MALAPRPDLSRHKLSERYTDADSDVVIEEREPFSYEDRADNNPHVAKDGDTWDTLAQFYYWDLATDAGQLWWIIADFQPEPEVNPFIPIRPGQLVIVPSEEFAREILGTHDEVFV